MEIHLRKLNDKDYKEMRSLILKEGPNIWNYITEDSIDHQLRLIQQNKASAVVAEDPEILGFAILIFRTACPQMLKKYDDLNDIAYIGDVIVHGAHSGKGVGSKLLQESVAEARKRNINRVYIDRHEENLASAGMMRKAGFKMIETFHDPDKRPAGSRNTTVLRWETAD